MKFDIKHLNLEYISWTINWGQARNDQDLRFGQYLDHKYDLKLHLSDRSIGLFYNESPDEVYNEILRVLEQHEQERTT